MESGQERIVLWGAENAGRNYVRRHKNSNIVAFVDNDPRKQGTKIDGIPVMSPDELLSHDFEILIITSWEIVPIRRQIEAMRFKYPVKIEEAGKEDISFVSTIGIPPFSHEKTHRFAADMLVFLSQCAKKNKVKLFLDFGTLLGVIRDGRLIPEDQDVDLSVTSTDCFRKTKDLILPLLHEFTVSRRVGMKAYLTKVKGNEVSLLLLLSSPEEDIIDFPIDIKKRVFVNGCSVTQTIPAWSCPDHFFLSCDYFRAFGEDFSVPMDHESYLSFLYGNWRTKRNDFKASEYGGIETDVPWEKAVFEKIEYAPANEFDRKCSTGILSIKDVFNQNRNTRKES
jgi:hypothetical protein